MTGDEFVDQLADGRGSGGALTKQRERAEP